MHRKILFLGLLFLSFPGVAQRIQLPDLIQYLNAPVQEFEAAMLRKGFVCYQSSVSLQQGWACLFAYQPAYLAKPEQATAIIEYVRSTRSDVVVYQLRSAEGYKALKKELVSSGYQMEVAADNRCIFSYGDIVINCKQTDSTNGLSGNYNGYSITLMRRRV